MSARYPDPLSEETIIALRLALHTAKDADGLHVLVPEDLVFTPWILDQIRALGYTMLKDIQK